MKLGTKLVLGLGGLMFFRGFQNGPAQSSHVATEVPRTLHAFPVNQSANPPNSGRAVNFVKPWNPDP